MERFLFALVLASVTAPAAALDIQECVGLAARYATNPFALSVQDLDRLRLCAAEQMAATVQARQDEREARAIERNFARPLRDDDE